MTIICVISSGNMTLDFILNSSCASNAHIIQPFLVSHQGYDVLFSCHLITETAINLFERHQLIKKWKKFFSLFLLFIAVLVITKNRYFQVLMTNFRCCICISGYLKGRGNYHLHHGMEEYWCLPFCLSIYIHVCLLVGPATPSLCATWCYMHLIPILYNHWS